LDKLSSQENDKGDCYESKDRLANSALQAVLRQRKLSPAGNKKSTGKNACCERASSQGG
jgi:hypothetical protein